MKNQIVIGIAVGVFTEIQKEIIEKAFKRRHVTEQKFEKRLPEDIEVLEGYHYILCRPEIFYHRTAVDREKLKTFNFWVIYSHEEKVEAMKALEQGDFPVMYIDENLKSLSRPF